MPKFIFKNSVDYSEEQVIKFIQGTNGDNFVSGYKGCGKKFKANDLGLVFEVICQNKPNADVGCTWEEVPTEIKERKYL